MATVARGRAMGGAGRSARSWSPQPDTARASSAAAPPASRRGIASQLGSCSRPGAMGIGIAWVATASTTSVSSASSSASWSPSQSTRKLPVTPPSAWMTIPGKTSSPSSKPSRSMSKWASPIPHALCVGFSRSWALIAIWKAFRFFAIFEVSATVWRLATGLAPDLLCQRGDRRAGDPVALAGPQHGTGDRVDLGLAAGADVAPHRGGQALVGLPQLVEHLAGLDRRPLGARHRRALLDRPGQLRSPVRARADLAERRIVDGRRAGQRVEAHELAPQDLGLRVADARGDLGGAQQMGHALRARIRREVDAQERARL